MRTFFARLTLVPALLLLLFVAGCDSRDALSIINGEQDPESAEQLMTLGDQNRRSGNYENAAALYALVELWFPLDARARDAQLLAAYCHYWDREYESALTILERYMFLNPGGSKTDYAYFLRAMVFYDQIPDVYRDQAVTKEALTAFNEFLTLYPEGRYSEEARVRRREVRGQIAGQEMVVARYYLSVGNYLAAYNGFQEVVLEYRDTNQAPEAYYRLVETSLALGLRGEAARHRNTLVQRYPDSEWTARATVLIGT